MNQVKLQDNSNSGAGRKNKEPGKFRRAISRPFAIFSLSRGDIYHGRSLHNYSNDIEEAINNKGLSINQGGTFKEDLVKFCPSFESFDFGMFKRTYQVSFYYQGVSGVKLGRTTIDETCDNALEVLSNQNMHSEYTRVFKAAVNLNYELVLLEALHNLPKISYPTAGGSRALTEECKELCEYVAKETIAYRLQDIKFDEGKKIFRSGNNKPVILKFIKKFVFRFGESNDVLSDETQRTGMRERLLTALGWGEAETQKIRSLSPPEHQILAWHVAFSGHVREVTKLLGILFASSLTEEETEGEKVSDTLKGILKADVLASVKQVRYLVRRDLPKYVEEKAEELKSIYAHLNAMLVSPVTTKMADILHVFRASKFRKALVRYMKFETSKVGKMLDKLTWYSFLAESAAMVLGLLSMTEALGTIGNIADILRGDAWALFNNLIFALFLTKLPGKLLSNQYEKNARSKLL